MTLAIVAVCVGALLASFFALRAIFIFVYRDKYPLEVKKRALSVDEQNFLKCLERALGDEYYIMPRVRLLDIGFFSSSSSLINQYIVNNRIVNLCADFVLCRKSNSSVLGIVELEKINKTDSPRQKKRREEILTSICQSMDIKLFYFDARQDYVGMDIRRLITGRVRPKAKKVIAEEASMASVAESSMMQVERENKKTTCPKCYSDVVTKIAVKGDNIGEKFLMCRKYPYCDYHISLKDAVVKENERKNELSKSKAGYRNW